MSKLTILIQYKLREEEKVYLTELTPEEYFDLELDEQVGIDCVPLYNHAIDYISVELEKIESTKISIADSEAQYIEITTEIFWDYGKSFLIERTEKDRDRVYNLRIINFRLSDSPIVDEIVRFETEDEFSFPILRSHVLITTHEDGSQSEEVLP
jgi:hypothetical protein